MPLMQACLLAMPCIPWLVFLGLGLSWLLGYDARERTVAFLTNFGSLLSLLAAVVLIASMMTAGVDSVSIGFGQWFSVGNYHFPMVFFVDWLSAPMAALTILLAGVVSAFSKRYVHREKGFFRFFLLLNLFMFGAVLVFTSGSFDLLIGGWELVGITSVLLISFFQERSEPVQNAIRVFATYRGCDIGLLVGAFVLYEHVGPSTFANLFIGNWPLQTTPLAGAAATIAALLLLLAASVNRRRSRSAAGCPERWKVPRHRALSSMARSRFISERISCCELIRSCSNRPWQARSLLLWES